MEKPQPNRWRCLISGCNPILNEETAAKHKETTGHRVAKWPVRSADGQAKAQKRNQTGYYRKYNFGDKSPMARGLKGYGGHSGDYEPHPFSAEALGQD